MDTETNPAAAPARRRALSIIATIVVVALVAAAAAALVQKLLFGNVKLWITFVATLVAVFGTVHRSWRELRS